MQASIKTVAFVGVSAIEIDVQIQIINGLPAFTIVGLPDKAVAESTNSSIFILDGDFSSVKENYSKSCTC